MTVKEIISSTRSYNLHSHTQFCDGRADMARFADAAVKAGYKHYGFTPHSPIPFHSPCNMEQSQVEEYISEFNRLKEEYRGRINLYLSMEIDYLGEAWGASHDYFSSLPLDYKLSSIHFIPVADGETMIDVDGRPENFLDKMSKYFDNDIRYVVDKFYERTLEMIEAGQDRLQCFTFQAWHRIGTLVSETSRQCYRRNRSQGDHSRSEYQSMGSSGRGCSKPDCHIRPTIIPIT